MSLEKFNEVATAILDRGPVLAPQIEYPSEVDVWAAYEEIEYVYVIIKQSVVDRAWRIAEVLSKEDELGLPQGASRHDDYHVGDKLVDVSFDFSDRTVKVRSESYVGNGECDSFTLLFPMKMMETPGDDINAHRMAVEMHHAKRKEEEAAAKSARDLQAKKDREQYERKELARLKSIYGEE